MPTSSSTSAASHPFVAVLTRIALVLIVLAVGGGIMAALTHSAPKIDTADADAVRSTVQVFEPRPVEVCRQWRGYGTARALDSADVPARLTTTVAEIPEDIRDGAAVQRGQLLAMLDAADFHTELQRLDAAIAEAEANLVQLDVTEKQLTVRLGLEHEDLAIAQAELARVRRLAERNVTSTQDVDRARSEELATRRALTITQETLDALPAQRQARTAMRTELEAQREMAQLRLERTRVVSPIAGVLQQVDVDAGEAVTPGQRIARVVDPAVIEIPIRLPGVARADLRVGDPVTLQATDNQTAEWTAHIVRIAPEDDPQTRTVTVFALLEQPAPAASTSASTSTSTSAASAAATATAPQPRLAPGVFVEAVVSTGQPTRRTVVPRRALRKQRLQVVLPDADGNPVVTSHPVQIDYTLRGALPRTGLDDDQWAVLAGDALPPGATILVTASASVLDGEAINPVPVGTPAQTPAVARTTGDAPQRQPEASP